MSDPLFFEYRPRWSYILVRNGFVIVLGLVVFSAARSDDFELVLHGIPFGLTGTRILLLLVLAVLLGSLIDGGKLVYARLALVRRITIEHDRIRLPDDRVTSELEHNVLSHEVTGVVEKRVGAKKVVTVSCGEDEYSVANVFFPLENDYDRLAAAIQDFSDHQFERI